MSSLDRWCSTPGMAILAWVPRDASTPSAGPHPPRLLPDVLGLALALGRGEVLKLILAHRLVHLLRCALQVADLLVAAFGGKRGARRLLLSLRLRRHRIISSEWLRLEGKRRRSGPVLPNDYLSSQIVARSWLT